VQSLPLHPRHQRQGEGRQTQTVPAPRSPGEGSQVDDRSTCDRTVFSKLGTEHFVRFTETELGFLSNSCWNVNKLVLRHAWMQRNKKGKVFLFSFKRGICVLFSCYFPFMNFQLHWNTCADIEFLWSHFRWNEIPFYNFWWIDKTTFMIPAVWSWLSQQDFISTRYFSLFPTILFNSKHNCNKRL